MNYTKSIINSKTFDELNKVKQEFLNECAIQEKRISVSEEIKKINNYGDIKSIFESITPQLFKTSEGRRCINTYTKLIKENKALKSEYLLYEGIKENKGKIDGTLYLNEALNILGLIDKNELEQGIKSLIPNLVESLQKIGLTDLNWIENRKDTKLIDESIEYLLTTQKNLLNLGEHSKNFNTVSNFITIKEDKEEDKLGFSIESSLSDILNDFRNKSNIKVNEEENFYEEIQNSTDKQQLFESYKESCINTIDGLLNYSSNSEKNKLNEMREKLSEKKYNYNSLTKDIIKFKDLQKTLSEIWEQK